MNASSFQKVREAAAKNNTQTLIAELPYLIKMRQTAVDALDRVSIEATNMALGATLDVLLDRVPELEQVSDEWDEALDDDRTMAEWVADWFAAQAVKA